MKPRELLFEAQTPDGRPITLTREGGGFMVRIAGASLMSSRLHGSEEAMAELACAPLAARAGARVLVGGLGMGFTLRAALDVLGADAEVVVSELFASVVAWNRDVLADLAGRPLDDPRVSLVIGDLAGLLRSEPAPFDAILLDVDNGPEAFTVASNAWLYRAAGLERIHAALRPGGMVVVWSAAQSPRFTAALHSVGLAPQAIPVRARGAIKKGSRHVLYVGRKPLR